MNILNYYKIKRVTSLITGEFNRNGKLCTRVVEGIKTFLVDQTPEQVLEYTLNHRGFNLKGARSGSKFLLGKMKMYPIIVDPIEQICMFPHKSPANHQCIWFNVDHISYTAAANLKTNVYLSNGRNLTIDSKLTSFNQKKEKAIQLKKLTTDRSGRTMSMVLEPHARYQLCKQTGKYNFTVSETSEE